jgi:N-acyl-D-amino-acid deacylase
LVKPGFAADLVVFDPNTVKDLSTFEQPHQYATGFHYVLVNGQIVADSSGHTGVRSGQVLVGPGTKRNQ